MTKNFKYVFEREKNNNNNNYKKSNINDWNLVNVLPNNDLNIHEDILKVFGRIVLKSIALRRKQFESAH